MTRRPSRLPHSLQGTNDVTSNFLGGYHCPRCPSTDTRSAEGAGEAGGLASLTPVTPADVAGRVRALAEIFSQLHVSSPGCQRMLVCNLAKDPEQFSPLSHLVLDLLELDTAQVERRLGAEDTVQYLDLLQVSPQ